jgi:quercetin dioxygenase-like cupin family protein
MHYVGRIDWAFTKDVVPASATASGLARQVLIGRAQGAVHTELAVGQLTPKGWLKRHVHSFEEALYVLDGELLLEVADRAHRLTGGDFALIPVGIWHALGNASGAPVRWLGVNTPQRLPADAGRRDTFFAPEPMDLAAMDRAAQRPPFGDPTLRWVGHYPGTPPQLEALRVADPARGRKPAGMDTALLAYSGISVKMLVDRGFGADLLTMFTVDYELGGAAQAHDHPFEETYFFLAGETEAELDGKSYRLCAGDVVFAGVGSVHGFYNIGAERVRWIETQAPQPPVRHAYRWVDSWKRFEESSPG